LPTTEYFEEQKVSNATKNKITLFLTILFFMNTLLLL